MNTPQTYCIIHPQIGFAPSQQGAWCVLKRMPRGYLEKIAEVTSRESAIAVLPTGLTNKGTYFGIEIWEV